MANMMVRRVQWMKMIEVNVNLYGHYFVVGMMDAVGDGIGTVAVAANADDLSADDVADGLIVATFVNLNLNRYPSECRSFPRHGITVCVATPPYSIHPY